MKTSKSIDTLLKKLDGVKNPLSNSKVFAVWLALIVLQLVGGFKTGWALLLLPLYWKPAAKLLIKALAKYAGALDKVFEKAQAFYDAL